MSFWAKSTGAAAEATMDQEGAESGKLVQIPDNTMVQAVITDVEMGKAQEADFIEGEYEYEGYRITWNIIEDGEFSGVNVRQNLRVLSNVNSKRDQALDVLAFMDLHMNGGKFVSAGEAPDVVDMLEAFQNKPMLVKIRAMAGQDEATGRETYNQWVSGVFRKKPESKEAHATAADAVKSAMNQVNQQKSAAAAGPKPTGPKPTGPGAKPTETVAEKRARMERELAAEEEAEQQAKQNANASSDDVNQMAQQDANEIDGAEEKLDY
jgi:hypothetical protein